MYFGICVGAFDTLLVVININSVISYHLSPKSMNRFVLVFYFTKVALLLTWDTIKYFITMNKYVHNFVFIFIFLKGS